jgi:hypothetical protein
MTLTLKIILGLCCLPIGYVLIRLISKAIFQSFFEVKKKFKDERKGEGDYGKGQE